MPVFAGRTLAAAFAALLLLAAPAAGQGFVIATPDSAARITFGGRVQTIFNTTSVDDLPAARTELRRVRLEASAEFGDLLYAKIQPDFAGSRVSLRDAYVRLDLHPAAQLLAGQAQRPFGIIAPSSSTRIIPIERGVRIRGVSDGLDAYNLVADLGYAERDVGLQLRGAPRNAPLGLSYAVGFFNGPAASLAPAENTWQAVARVAARPVDAVRVGASWSRIDHVFPGGGEAPETRAGQAWAADVELGAARGLRFIGEATYGDYDPFAGAEFFGAQGWLAYRTGPVSSSIAALEPLLRVSHGNPDVDDVYPAPGPSGGTLITPGVNLWLGGLNRLALNYEIWTPESGERVHSFKTLFQLAF